MLCVPRQLAELLKLSLEDILQDFDAICSGDWRQRGVSPAEIRTFCVWRNAPMFFVDCRGRLLDCFQPMQKEERAIAYTAWNGHAFFCARAVVGCDEAERHRYRRQRQDSSTPEFSEWKPWAGEIGCGHFWSEDLRSVRAQLLAAGHQPKVALRGLCEWSALRLRASGGDCVIRELCEDAQVLQEWTQRLGVPYPGRALRSSCTCCRGAGTTPAAAERLCWQNRTGCASSAVRPSRRRPASWTTSFRCTRLTRDVLRMPQSQNQYGGESQHHPGEPLLSLRLPELRRAAPGLPAAEMGRRAPLRGHRRVPLPEERAGQRSLPHPCLLSPRLHRARLGGRACGSHLRGLALRRPQRASGPAALRRQGLVFRARLCGDAGLRAGAVAPLSLEPGGRGARGPTLAGAGAAGGATARCTISSWGRSIQQWPGSDEPWRRCRSATSSV